MTPSTPTIGVEELFRYPQAEARDDGTSVDDIYCITTLTPVTAQKDPGKEMWATYMNEVKEDDIRDAAAWRQDAEGILVFVSPNIYGSQHSSQ